MYTCLVFEVLNTYFAGNLGPAQCVCANGSTEGLSFVVVHVLPEVLESFGPWNVFERFIGLVFIIKIFYTTIETTSTPISSTVIAKAVNTSNNDATNYCGCYGNTATTLIILIQN